MTRDPEARLTELEIQLAHLSRLFDQLNEVVTEQANGFDRTRRQVATLKEQLEALKHKPADSDRDPIDEKPPHY